MTYSCLLKPRYPSCGVRLGGHRLLVHWKAAQTRFRHSVNLNNKNMTDPSFQREETVRTEAAKGQNKVCVYFTIFMFQSPQRYQQGCLDII
jgi:hypothetical protein